jgi:ADP-ribose pyrophosphatase YjhB (NUDIX family)
MGLGERMKIKPVGVGIAIKNKQILLITDDEDDYKLPGGRVEEKESLEETVKREVKEETSCDVRVIDFVDTFTRFLNGTKYIMFNYRIKLEGNPFPGNEAKTVGWYDYRNCQKITLSPDSRHIVELSRKKGWF